MKSAKSASAGKKLTEAGKDTDTGFKVFRLDSSNLKLWDDTPIENGDLDSLFARMNGMLICLQSGVTAETVEKLAALKPQKIVLVENALADNSAMSNAHYLLENRGIELKIV